jgi:uncharacterized membrane protein
MIGTPLARQGGVVRRVLANVVVGGLAATTAQRSTARSGATATATTAAGIVVGTAAVERIGTATGVPFGRYAYTEALRPQVAHVPALVPMAWYAMALPSHQAAHAALGARSTRARRIVLGSVALTAWDLFLDPQMVGEGYWRWARRGRYRGIPLSNFVGWFVTGLAVMTWIDVRHPPTDDHPAADATMVGQYTFMAVMETVGFAAFFRDRLVAAVGAAGMLPVALAAARRFAGNL